jgi:hypothetical protein
MFCPGCGAKLQIDGAFCHKCGRRIHSIDSSVIALREINRATFAARNERTLLAIRHGAPSLSICQICSASAELSYMEFGLGKLEIRRRWDETFISALVSAVSLPVFGLGMTTLPTKKSGMRVIRLRLILCSKCLTARPDFRSHPWFRKLWECGYNQFIPPEQLSLFLQ